MAQDETHPRTLVYVVDDEAVFRHVARATLQAAGYEVEAFESAEECLARMKERVPAAILLDLGLDGMSGQEALRHILEGHRHVAVIVVSAERSPAIIASVTQRGAYDYVLKPVDRERLATTTRNAVGHHLMSLRITELERASPSEDTALLIGGSPPMAELRARIQRVAGTDVSVLIRGESGSGKELVARAIHAASARRDRPFVAINCAAIPENLEEAELFGHEKGAFTGATARRMGRIERADGGTFLLDEIAELSPSSQSKLLRVLQERSLQRVGGNQEVHVDFRLIAASNASLHDEVAQGRFREDLFYRIVVYEIDVPPLRDRSGDVALLVDHFLRELGPRLIGRTPAVSPETIAVLEHYPWPGNVRELQNAVQRGIVNCSGPMILPSDLPSWIAARMRVRSSSLPPAPASQAPGAMSETDRILPTMTLDQVEKRAIEMALERAGGTIAKAARELGIARSTLYRKLRQHGISTRS